MSSAPPNTFAAFTFTPASTSSLIVAISFPKLAARSVDVPSLSTACDPRDASAPAEISADRSLIAERSSAVRPRSDTA